MRQGSRLGDARITLGAALAVLVPAFLLTDGTARELVSAAAAVLPAAVLGALLARHLLAGPRPWRLLWAGLLLLAGTAVADVAAADVLAGAPDHLVPSIAHLLFLAAAVAAVSWPVGRPRGWRVDAGIFALSTSMVLWTLLVGPHLDGLAAPQAARLRTFAALLALGATAAALVAAAWTFRVLRRPVTYLLLAVTSSAAGIVAVQLTASAAAASGAWWTGLLWILAFSAVTAAVVDPAARDLAPHLQPRADRISAARLGALGTALAVGPLLALGTPALAVPADRVVLPLGTLALVPLVLGRIAQLVRLRAAAEEQLTHLAGHDELTGLANRRRLVTHLSEALERLDRGETPGVVLLFCDVDDFKLINDDHGHRVGDEVLRLVTRRLLAAVRGQDVVARVGGDEFVVVVEGDPAATESETRARVERALGPPMAVGSVLMPVAVSVGSASAAPGAGVTVDHLLAAADASMYAQKRARRADRPAWVDAPRDTDPAPAADAVVT